MIGLLLLRQRDAAHIVYANAATRERAAWIDPLLHQFSGVGWREPPHEFELLTKGIEFRQIDLGASVAYEFRDVPNQKTAMIAPAVPEVTGELRLAMQRADNVLFDGTFWSENELRDFRPLARTSSQMGHVPVQESLTLLSDCPGRKIYMHINNTNPMLQPGSAERQQVEAAGIAIGVDGMEFET